MAVREVVSGVYVVGLGGVNVFLVEGDEGLVLIDAGLPHRHTQILSGLRDLGREPQDVRFILLTHSHIDHVGGLVELKKATGASVVAHPATAEDLREGVSMRPVSPAPGWMNHLIYNLTIKRAKPTRAPAFEVDLEVGDGEEIAGGFTTVHSPGHTLGHMAYFWPRQGGVLFVGDAAMAMVRLGLPLIFESYDEGLHSLAKLGAMDFQVACLAHGRPIVAEAAMRFREKWG